MAKLMIDGNEVEFADGLKYEVVAGQYQKQYNNMIALVLEDGRIRELTKPVHKDCNISFLTLKDSAGHKAYVRTGLMTLAKATHDVLGKDRDYKLKVEFVIGQGYYCSLNMEKPITCEETDAIRNRMRELVEADRPITKRSYPIEDALKLFEERKMTDKVKLFKFRRGSFINVYCLDDFYDYFYGFMLPSTGYLKYYDVMQYEDGLLLLIPNSKEPDKIDFFEPREKLFHALNTSTSWGKQMGVETVGDLNETICRGEMSDMILVQESLQERRIAEIAEAIVKRGNVKIIMIAGPSSSGKTTFSHRLSVQLRTFGLTPHPIPMDDYFVPRAQTPRDENGDYDYECLEAIDVKLFNENMNALLRGEKVELPTYNFKTGEREYKGNYKQLGPDDILVIEGIHGLNPKTTESLPDDAKFKIYISALTSLNIDEHNRIPTTDGRLLRRMVRDARTRGASAKRTIQMWPSVRRGEEKYIFPFQETADEMFNSVLIYELSVLKQYAEPLLYSIDKDEPEYYEAKRLLKFLEYFLGIDSTNVPNNSICREFIGGSYFNV